MSTQIIVLWAVVLIAIGVAVTKYVLAGDEQQRMYREVIMQYVRQRAMEWWTQMRAEANEVTKQEFDRWFSETWGMLCATFGNLPVPRETACNLAWQVVQMMIAYADTIELENDLVIAMSIGGASRSMAAMEHTARVTARVQRVRDFLGNGD